MPAQKGLNRTGKPVTPGRRWATGGTYLVAANAYSEAYTAASLMAEGYQSEGYEARIRYSAPVKRPGFTVKYRMLVDSKHKQFTYTGSDEHLVGHTALGMFDKDGSFVVQVDDINHKWSHKWHKTNICDWAPRDIS